MNALSQDDQPDALELNAGGLPPADDGHDSLRRAAAMLWLAEAAPLSSAPAESLETVRARLGLTKATARPLRSSRWRAAAAAGWAAAAGLAILLWRAPDKNSPNTGVGTPPVFSNDRGHTGPGQTAPDSAETPKGGTLTPLADAAALRGEIARLREQLKATAVRPPGAHRPVIHELTPPGGATRASSPEHVLNIIASALETDLARRTGQNGHELIIESGWANWSAANLSAETVFRHRAFPAGRSAELGLLRGPDGQFLDPSNGWLWSPDPDSTDYLGHAAPAGLNRTAFVPAEGTPQMQIAAAPAGYAITGSNGQTIIALSNLPAIPAGTSLDVLAVNHAGQAAAFNIPLSANSLSDGWSFSGIVPSLTIAGDFTSVQSFGVRTTGVTGQTGVILQTE